MKTTVKACILGMLISMPIMLQAQQDSVWLQCPLDEAMVVPPPKNVIHYDQPDLCIVLVSKPDTAVKACITGKVTNVEQTEDGKWDVVFYYKDYYFWYSGLSKVIVRRNEVVKVGQALGYLTPGNQMEMLLYKFETQLDPTRYLSCKTVLKKE
jgi:hypothetical protein